MSCDSWRIYSKICFIQIQVRIVPMYIYFCTLRVIWEQWRANWWMIGSYIWEYTRFKLLSWSLQVQRSTLVIIWIWTIMDLWSRYRHTLLFSRKLPLLVSSKNGCPSEGIPEPFLHHGLATLSLSDLQSWSRDGSDADNRFDLSAINYNDVPLLTVYSRLSFEKTLTSSDLCFGSVQLGS